ncbi:YdbH domain-containing protein [soil metagenome]
MDASTFDDQKTPAARAPRGWRRLWIGLLIGLLVVSVAVAAVYLNRRAVAKRVLTGWLESRGVTADVSIDRLELDRFVGRIRIGDPRNPDVSVERVEVDYALAGPWAAGGLGVTPSRIRLVRPIVRATWANGRLSLGSLDPIIKEFTGKPPRPDSRSPVVVIEGGRLGLTTEYGPVQVLADATLDNGKLMRLHAAVPSVDLESGHTSARALAGTVNLVTTGDRVAARIDLSARRLAATGFEGETLHLTGTGDLPYPDLKTGSAQGARNGDGRARLALELTGASLGAGGNRGRDAVARVAFDGQTRGWIQGFRISGRTEATIQASGLSGPVVTAGRSSVSVTQGSLDIVRDASGLRWSHRGPVALRTVSARVAGLALADTVISGRDVVLAGGGAGWSAQGPLAISAGRATFDTLSLSGVDATFALDAGRDDRPDAATRVQGNGSLRSIGGSWPLFGPRAADDIPELGEMKRALGSFAVAVPAFRLETGSVGTQMVLSAPARITPVNGGVVTLSPVARPIFAARSGERGGGAMNVVMTRGRGLPQATVAVPDWHLTAGGFQARLDARAALDFGLARGLDVTTSGVLATDRGLLTYTAAGCSAFTSNSLELGENDVSDLSGRFCPAGRPLVSVRDGRWRADGHVEAVAASAPFLGMRFDRAEAVVAVTGGPAGLGLRTQVASMRITDATQPRRFNPLSASGQATLRDDVWTGDFDVAYGPHALAKVKLTDNALTQIASVTIDASQLTFVQGGLQPAMLTPLGAEIVKSPVTGSVAFNGRFEWSPALPDGASSGRLVIPGLDFVSPAGPVKGLTGTIDFTSLAPLVTAPGQRLHVASLETVTPLTDLDLTFGLDAASLKVGGGQIAAAGGFVSVEPFDVPLDQTASGGLQSFAGALVFDRIQLGELIAGSGFEDKVSLDAVVSGRLPFRFDATTGVSISQGTLAAVQPGRLSIQREALSDLQAGGGGAVPASTVEDLAYQAMQNLAFDTLSADVNSLDQGRVNVLFHIKGRHDPPQRQELRLSLPDLISRKFLNRTLPLPSDTGIDLTLDTTLNIDQLVSDLLEVNRQRNGTAQPVGTPVATGP